MRASKSDFGSLTVGAFAAQAMIRYAELRGVAPGALIDRFALHPDVLSDVDGRLPAETMTRMWDEMPALCGDPELPLNLAELLDRAEPPLAGLLVLSSPTLREGLARVIRYERIWHDAQIMEHFVEGDWVHSVLHVDRSPRPMPHAPIVFGFASLLLFARRATRQPLRPASVSFTHAAPPNDRRYREVFDCPVHFGAADNRLTAPAAYLDLPHPDASRMMLQVLDRHVTNSLSQLPPLDDLRATTRHALLALLPDGDCSVEKVALRLGLAPRTFQRRLAASGTTLRDLVDELRHELALLHIADPRTPLADVAFALGFSDQTAFHRAFVRWTGDSPGAHRRALRAAAAR